MFDVAIYGRTENEIKRLKREAIASGYLKGDNDYCIKITSSCEEKIRFLIEFNEEIKWIFLRPEHYDKIKKIANSIKPIEVLVVLE